MKTKGFHHITMNCRDPKENLWFYRDVLGFSFVKQTVNFDDPFTYHLYYGDEKGSPGTLLTFFPFENTPKAQHGCHEIRQLAFGIFDINYWEERLEKQNISYTKDSLFGDEFLQFSDPDGLEIRLLVSQQNPSTQNIWGLLGVTITVSEEKTIQKILHEFGYEFSAKEQHIQRYVHAESNTFIDVEQTQTEPATFGYGQVHHLAFHMGDDDREQMRSDIQHMGYAITPVIDRQYFYSLYFRIEQGVLFECATTGPGMFVDEEELGSTLCIPKQHVHLTPLIRQKLETLQ
ncbi:MAG: VOC family protein [Candidatus Woesearchaeota archaeon]